MPWSKMSEVIANLRKLNGISLTLSQANEVASVADALNNSGKDDSSAWAIAISQFKINHKIRNGSWVSEKTAEDKSFTLVEKQDDGSYWITAVSTADVMDREGETFGIEAMDYDIEQAKRHGDYPEFRVFHSKHLGIGKVEKMNRVGIFAIDEGKSYTDPFSLAICNIMLSGNNGKYRCSRGFRVVEASGSCPNCSTQLVIKDDHFYGFTCPVCMNTRSRFKELNGVRYRKARTYDVTITDIPCVPMTGAKAIKLPVEDGIMTKEELRKRLLKAGIDAEIIEQRLKDVGEDEMKQYNERPFAEVLKEFVPEEDEEVTVSQGQVFTLDPDVLKDFTTIVRKEVQEALNGITIEIPDSDIELKEIPGLVELKEQVDHIEQLISTLIKRDEQRLKEMLEDAPRSGKLRIRRAVYKADKTDADEEDSETDDNSEEEMTEEEMIALMKKKGKKEMPLYLQKMLSMEKDIGNGAHIVGADGVEVASMSEFITGGGNHE